MQELKNNLKKYFGFSDFRNGQDEIVQEVLNKRNLLVVMPTGGGKSLCYQLPAIVFPGTAIVISPLISLMKDQSDALELYNIPATYINSSISTEEFNQRIFFALNGKYKLIYIAPERLESEYFLSVLNKINISFVAVDEAHCISHWGHDFRPSYLNISKALENINVSHVLALTATATPEVQLDIIKSLNMSAPKLLVRGFDRPNLTYLSRQTTNKTEEIINILDSTSTGSSIIYCGSRKKTVEIYNTLLKKNINAACYHAGMSANERKINQEKFIKEDTNIIVATNAFGMGIDKPNVRNVIHCSLTGSLEAYYQEAGRAGRDGLESNCFLFYDYSDIKLQEYFIETAFPDVGDFEKVYNYLANNKTSLEDENEITIANKTGLLAAKVSSIITNFEKAGMVKKHSYARNLQILLKTTHDELNSYSKYLDEEKKLVVEALLRSLSTESFKKFVDIDINHLTKKYNIKQETLFEHLQALQLLDILKFNAPLLPNAIIPIHNFDNFQNIPIDFDLLFMRKNMANDKFKIMQEYANTKDCKRNFILNYFKDDSYTGKCNKCSSCRKKPPVIPQKIDKITHAILIAAKELEGRFGRFLLSEYLLGKKSEKILQYLLYNYDSFGILSKQNIKTWELISKIDSAIETGLLLISKEQYPVVAISITGEKFLKENPQPIFNSYNTNKSIITNNKTITNSNYNTNTTINKNINSHSCESTTNISKKKRLEYNKLNNSMPVDFNFIRDINNLFISGLNIDEVSKKTKISKGDIALSLQKYIENGFDLDWKYYTDYNTYNKIRRILVKTPYLLLKDIQKQLDIPIDFALLRIITALIKQKNI